MRKFLPILPFIAFVFLLRLTNLSIRLSDTNIYFYTAYKMLQGNLLYKDIFFTNFPLFPYISTFYLLISHNNILFYYFTPTIEISSVTILIYYLIYEKSKDKLISFFSSMLYLFSFMVLSTSEHQTGVFIASLFSLIAYYFWERKNNFWVGVFLGLTLLTKAYFIPIVLSFVIFSVFKKQYKQFTQINVGLLITIFVILLPSLIFTPQYIYKDIILYSLTRSAGVSKMDIFWFFILKDSVFSLLLLFNLFNFRKQPFFSLVSVFSLLLFLFYKDAYYLYFNFLPPFLCISFHNFTQYLQKQFPLQKMVIPTVLTFFLMYTFSTYYSNYRNLGTFTDSNQLLIAINKIHPSVLYGVNDTTPALAFLSNTPMLNDIVDTNTNIFRKGLLNATVLTSDAVKQKALVVVHGALYPEYNVNEPVADEIVDKKILLQHCKLVVSQPIYTEGLTNRINLFSCK